MIPENTSKNTHNVIEQLLLEDNPLGEIADIPCGEGAFTKRLTEKHRTVVPCDIQNILKFAHLNFCTTDMNNRLPFEDNRFEAIVCIDGIEHIERPFDFVRECNRTLKKNGTLLISTPNINSLRSRWRWFMTGHHNKCKTPLNENRKSPLHHINMISYHELRYMLHTNGFKIIRIATNRIKFISYLYFIWLLPCYIATFLEYRNEKDEIQKELNNEILKEVFSYSLLFGETTIVKAVKL